MSRRPSSEEDAAAEMPRGWDGAYISRLAEQLMAHPILLETICTNSSHYLKKLTVEMQKSRKQALATVAQALAPPVVSPPVMRKRILDFRKLYFQMLRRLVSKAEEEARAAPLPRWMRLVAPLMEAGERGRPDEAWGGVDAVMEALTERARSLRTVEPAAVCRALPAAPHLDRRLLENIWARMQSAVRAKLEMLIASGDSEAGLAAGARLSPADWRLLDALLLHDSQLVVLEDKHVRTLEPLQALVAVFHLAQLFRLEEGGSWRAAHAAYRRRGLQGSVLLLQRRWHALRRAARRALSAAAASAAPVCPLHTAIARRFPHVVTEPQPEWQDLVAAGAVLEDYEPEENEEPLDVGEVSARLTLVSPPHAARLDHTQEEKEAEDDDDDLILIEQEIETVDLLAADEGEGVPCPPRPPRAPPSPPVHAEDFRAALRHRRQKYARALEEDLDKQLRDLEENGTPGAPAPPVALVSGGESPAVKREPASSDECSEVGIESEMEWFETDKEGIEMEKEEVETDKEGAETDKEEAETDKDEAETDKEGVESDLEGMESDKEPQMDIDPKLLMDACVRLVRVDSTPAWSQHARGAVLDVGALGGARLAALSAAQALVSSLLADDSDPDSEAAEPTEGTEQIVIVKVKTEGDVEEREARRRAASSPPPLDEKRARRCAAAGDRGDASDASDAGASSAEAEAEARVRKRVTLPDIAEVRRINQGMLTAQVAPLASAPPSDTTRSEEAARPLTRGELDAVLARIQERAAAGAGKARAAHCCPARRHRAYNGARRRNAAHAGRAPPPEVDLHSAHCVRPASGACTCCCGHLLDAEGAARALLDTQRRLREDIRAALAPQDEREDVNEDNSSKDSDKAAPVTTKPPAPPSAPRKCRGKSKKQTRVKDKSETKKSEQNETSSDPLEEWNRQKNLTSRFFDLNLKRPAPQRRIAPAPPRPPPPDPVAFVHVTLSVPSDATFPVNRDDSTAILKASGVQSEAQPQGRGPLMQARTYASSAPSQSVPRAAVPVTLLPLPAGGIRLMPANFVPAPAPAVIREDGVIDLCASDEDTQLPGSPSPPPAPPSPSAAHSSKNRDVLVRLPSGISVTRRTPRTSADSPEPPGDTANASVASAPDLQGDAKIARVASAPEPQSKAKIARVASVLDPQSQAKIARVASAPEPQNKVKIARVASAPEPQNKVKIARVASAPEPQNKVKIARVASAPEAQGDAKIARVVSAPEPRQGDLEVARVSGAPEPQGDTTLARVAGAPRRVLLNERIASALAATPTLQVSPIKGGKSNIKVFKISKDGVLTPAGRARGAQQIRKIVIMPRGMENAAAPPRSVLKLVRAAAPPAGAVRPRLLNDVLKQGEAASLGTPSAPPGTPSAPPGTPTAPPGTPSAPTGTPTASPGTPAAASGLKLSEIRTSDGRRMLVARSGVAPDAPAPPGQVSGRPAAAPRIIELSKVLRAMQPGCGAAAGRPLPPQRRQWVHMEKPASVMRVAPEKSARPAVLRKIAPKPQLYGLSDLQISVTEWARQRDSLTLQVHCLDRAVPYYSVLAGEYYVVCSAELQMARPSYWGARGRRPTRLVLPPRAPAPDAALAALPDQTRQAGRLYKKLSDNPLLYACVMFVVRSVEELSRAARAGAELHCVCTRTGDSEPLHYRSAPPHVACGYVGAAREITLEMSRLPREEPAPAEGVTLELDPLQTEDSPPAPRALPATLKEARALPPPAPSPPAPRPSRRAAMDARAKVVDLLKEEESAEGGAAGQEYAAVHGADVDDEDEHDADYRADKLRARRPYRCAASPPASPASPGDVCIDVSDSNDGSDGDPLQDV